MMKNKCGTCCRGRCRQSTIAWILVIIGALNWGLVGLGMLINVELNVVQILVGSVWILEPIIYLLVGLSALGALLGCRCKDCSTKPCSGGVCASAGTDTDKNSTSGNEADMSMNKPEATMPTNGAPEEKSQDVM